MDFATRYQLGTVSETGTLPTPCPSGQWVDMPGSCGTNSTYDYSTGCCYLDTPTALPIPGGSCLQLPTDCGEGETFNPSTLCCEPAEDTEAPPWWQWPPGEIPTEIPPELAIPGGPPPGALPVPGGPPPGVGGGLCDGPVDDAEEKMLRKAYVAGAAAAVVGGLLGYFVGRS